MDDGDFQSEVPVWDVYISDFFHGVMDFNWNSPIQIWYTIEKHAFGFVKVKGCLGIDISWKHLNQLDLFETHNITTEDTVRNLHSTS